MIDFCRRSFEPRSWPLIDEADPHRGPLSMLLLAVQLMRQAAGFFLPNVVRTNVVRTVNYKG